jgi:hypothetical protein
MALSNSRNSRTDDYSTDSHSWLAIVCFSLLFALLIAVHMGKIVTYAFPALSFVLGLYLYSRPGMFYIGFVWWISFLTPCVRRMADFYSSWTDPSPVLLAPYLVIFVSAMTVARYASLLVKREGMPFLFCFASVMYAFTIGYLKGSPQAAAVALLSWLAPILLGFHIFAHYREYPVYQQSIKKIFVWGTLVMGTYGIYQYTIAPPWDTAWMINTELTTNGNPLPYEIRVFSTLHSPQPFAGALKAGLLILLDQVGTLSLVASGVGYLSFFLSSARSAWVAWIISLITYVSVLKISDKIRLISWITVASFLIVPLTIIGPFAETFQARFESFQDLSGDTSYSARQDQFRGAMNEALYQIMGSGLGKDQFSGDNGILSMIFSLGWVGCLPYFLSLILIFYVLFRISFRSRNTSITLFTSIAFGTLEQIISNVAVVGLLGCVLWTFIGLALAGSKYHAKSLKNTTHNQIFASKADSSSI